jgi:hypothetical protein
MSFTDYLYSSNHFLNLVNFTNKAGFLDNGRQIVNFGGTVSMAEKMVRAQKAPSYPNKDIKSMKERLKDIFDE